MLQKVRYIQKYWNSMSKKYALTTGGSGYIGTAVVAMLVKNGFEVVNLGRNECDLTDLNAVSQVAKKVLEKRGAPDVLIHMAAPPLSRIPLAQITPAEVATERTITVGTLEVLTSIFLPHMKGGSVCIGITTAALAEKIPDTMGAYVTLKNELRILLKKLTNDWKEEGIHIYDVAPDFLPGGLNKDLPEGVRNLLARQKDGTIPTADDVAKTIEKLICG